MLLQFPQTAEVVTKQSYLKFVKVGRGAAKLWASRTVESRLARRPRARTPYPASDVTRIHAAYVVGVFGTRIACACAVQCTMVAMVASASGYGTLRRFLSVPEGQHDIEDVGAVPSTSVAVSVRLASVAVVFWHENLKDFLLRSKSQTWLFSTQLFSVFFLDI